jgi:hypothetical protein
VDDKPIRRSTKHEKKMRWLGEHEAELEKRYPGMWVAISDDGFAGVGKTLREAEEMATANGITDILVTGLKALEYQGVYLIR